MSKKYELISHDGLKAPARLYQIKALRSFGDVKEGDLGGYVEWGHNLSHEGTCWVYDEASVNRQALVEGNAKVYERAWVSGNAHIYGKAQIYGQAKIEGKASVYREAKIFEQAWVYGQAQVHGQAMVYGQAQISGQASIHQQAKVYGEAYVHDYSVISGQAEVYGESHVGDRAQIKGTAKLKDKTIYSTACLSYGEFIASTKVFSAAGMGLAFDITVTPHGVQLGNTRYPITEWERRKTEFCEQQELSTNDSLALFQYVALFIKRLGEDK